MSASSDDNADFSGEGSDDYGGPPPPGDCGGSTAKDSDLQTDDVAADDTVPESEKYPTLVLDTAASIEANRRLSQDAEARGAQEGANFGPLAAQQAADAPPPGVSVVTIFGVAYRWPDGAALLKGASI